jgi:hypothetical protein
VRDLGAGVCVCGVRVRGFLRIQQKFSMFYGAGQQAGSVAA